MNKSLSVAGKRGETPHHDELMYLLESGSDRIGALDFQLSSSSYVDREFPFATLEELQKSAERVENGVPLSFELDQALFHGTSLGGGPTKGVYRIGRQKIYCEVFLNFRYVQYYQT